MTRACHAAVRMATGEVFKDEEIDDLNCGPAGGQGDGEPRRANPSIAERAAIRDAMNQLTREELKAKLEQRRSQVMAKAGGGGQAAAHSTG